MRSRGQGTRLADGRWRCVLVVEQLDGTTRRKYFTAATQREAQAKRRAAELAQPQEDRRTVQDLVDWCKAKYWPALSEGTKRNREWAIGHLSPAFLSTRIPDVVPPLVKRELERIAARSAGAIGGRSISHIRATLHWLCRIAVEDGLGLASNPVSEVRNPVRVKKYEKRQVLEGDILRIAGHELQPEYRLAYATLLETGIRPSELLRLNAADLVNQFDRWWLSVTKSKTQAGTRLVPISEDLAAHLSGTPKGPLIPATDGGWMTMNQLRLAWDRCRRRAKLEEKPPADCSLYDFRRVRLTLHAQSGMPDQALQYLAGHTSARLTREIYAGLAPAHVADLVGVPGSVPKGKAKTRKPGKSGSKTGADDPI